MENQVSLYRKPHKTTCVKVSAGVKDVKISIAKLTPHYKCGFVLYFLLVGKFFMISLVQNILEVFLQSENWAFI